MKKILVILFICCLLSSAGLAEEYSLEYGSLGEFELQPGRYEIGVDVPDGYFDVRMKGLNQSCTIRFSLATNLDDSLNMDSVNSYELTFTSAVNYWQGCHPNIYLSGYGSILEIENSPCIFYPIEQTAF